MHTALAFLPALALRGATARRPRVSSRVHRRCARVPVASASAAGASGAAWRDRDREDDDRARERDTSSPTESSQPPSIEGGIEGDDASTVPISTDVSQPTSRSRKTENSAALQVDDGSQSTSLPPLVPLPRRLVRRRNTAPSLRKARESLLGSFLRSGVGGALVLLSLFTIWYGSNALFNVYNKQVLAVFPYPLTCTVMQFAVGAGVMCSLWVSRVKKAPPRAAMMMVAPLAACHAAGFLLTNMSLGKVSVAFTHTVKATEPFFSAALTPSILGDIPTWGIIGSLVPIVVGVALASANDTSFNWVGFLCAIGSNVALQARNVLSKKLMSEQDDEDNSMNEKREQALDSLDNVNLFATMTILALFLLTPIALLWEGAPLLAAAATPAITGMSTNKLWSMLLVGGVLRCADVLSSYMILKRVSPVTHSVGNCVKRAVVIGVSIIIFKTTVTWLSMFGTALALAGVLLYSLIVAACKQNSFGPESPVCKPVYESELELTEGGGI